MGEVNVMLWTDVCLVVDVFYVVEVMVTRGNGKGCALVYMGIFVYSLP
jgi:hypothetical protein